MRASLGKLSRIARLVVFFLCLVCVGTALGALYDVDLVDVAIYYDGKYTWPGNPGQNYGTRIEFDVKLDGYWWVQLYDPDTKQVIYPRYTGSTSGHYVWTRSWTFKSTPDALEVQAFRIGENTDTAYSYVPADTEWGDPLDDPRVYWSPNCYKHAMRMTSDLGPDFCRYQFHFFYWNDNLYGWNYGTQRLNELKDWTGFLGGQLQVEFRRDHEGWDAMYRDQWGNLQLYGWGSNLPGATAGPTTCEEQEFGGDEEAEIVTEHTEDMSAVTGHDPSQVWWMNGYWTYFHFYRKPAYRGQSITLDMEFELKESEWDTWFSGETVTRQSETV